MQKVHNNVPTKQGCVQIGAVGIYIDVLDDSYLEVERTNVYLKVEEELEEQGQTVNNTQGDSFRGALWDTEATRAADLHLQCTLGSAVQTQNNRDKHTDECSTCRERHKGKKHKFTAFNACRRIGSMLKNLGEDNSLDANTHSGLHTISAFWLNMYGQQLVSAVIKGRVKEMIIYH